MTVFFWGGVIPNGKPANKGFRREDRPDPYSERVEERRCLSDALRDEASEHTPTAGLRGRRLRPARGQAPQRFPERRRFSTRSGCAEEKRIDSRTSPHPALDGSAHPPLRRTGSCGGGSGFRIYQTFRQKVAGSQLSTPAPRRTPRETAAPTLCSAAPDRAAEATYQYSSVTDRGNRMGRAAASPNLKLLLEKETRRCRRPKLSAQTIRASKDGIVPSARSRFTCASTSS